MSNKTNDLNNFFQKLYKNFNERNINVVINEMAEDVTWANGMEGGYVHGHEGVREYWTRQFAMISSNVTPLEIIEDSDTVTIKVHQVAHDLKGNLLTDEKVHHIFTMKNNKVSRFDIETN